MEDLKKVFEKFCEKNDFQLNPNDKHTDACIGGVLTNEKNTGMKLCPCRLRDGTRERDLQLLCPCNFKIQKAWQDRGECWCGLFVKK